VIISKYGIESDKVKIKITIILNKIFLKKLKKNDLIVRFVVG
jgi:hypothetical protein